MARLLVHVEGVTEERFVHEVLAPHLYPFGYEAVIAKLLGRARSRAARGGARAWPAVQQDIVNHLRGDAGCIASTMVDYYGLPASGNKGWPDRETAATLPFDRKAATVEAGMLREVAFAMGADFDGRRFRPFVVMHEFEGLLFRDPAKLASGIERADLTSALAAIRSSVPPPEHINDSPYTAPSKRLLDLVPDYQKPTNGIGAALEIGLEAIRRECPQFNAWVAHLEGLLAVKS